MSQCGAVLDNFYRVGARDLDADSEPIFGISAWYYGFGFATFNRR
jgi:hypothetical protein